MSRAAVRRAAEQLFIDPARAELLVCLSRSDGLSRAPVPLVVASARLWRAWRRGGAWDEAARDPDLFRPGRTSTARAAALLRESLLEALLLMPATEFALRSDIVAAAISDRRALTAQRALTAAARGGGDVLSSALEVVSVLLDRSLPDLGLIDRGVVDQGEVVRIAPAARAWLERGVDLEEHSDSHQPVARWLGDDRLSCPAACDVAAIVEAGIYAATWVDDAAVGLGFTPTSLARACEHDPDLAGLRVALSVLASTLPSALDKALLEATSHRPACTMTDVAAFIAIEDAGLRSALYGDPGARDVWATPPLADGLLVKPGVSRERVLGLLTRHGARLHRDAPTARSWVPDHS